MKVPFVCFKIQFFCPLSTKSTRKEMNTFFSLIVSGMKICVLKQKNIVSFGSCGGTSLTATGKEIVRCVDTL